MRSSIYTTIRYLMALADAKFVEQEHPRGPDGEFVKKGAGKGGKSAKVDSTDDAPASNVRHITRDDVMEKDARPKSARAHLVHEPDRSKWPEHVKALKLPPAWTDGATTL